MEREDVALHLIDLRGIPRGGGLVEQEQVGIGEGRGGEGEELARPVGEAAGGGVGLVREADEVEQPARALPGLALEPPKAPGANQTRERVLFLVLLEEDEEVLERAQAREDADLLKRARDAQARHAMGRDPGQVAAAEEHATVVGGEVAGDAVEERGLARAVRADETHQLAGLDGEVHVVHGGDAEETLDETANLQQRHQRSARAPAARRSRLSIPSGERTTTRSRRPP